MWLPNCSLSIQFLNVFFHYYFFQFVEFNCFLFEDQGLFHVLAKNNSITSSMNISHVFSLIIFSFLEDWAIFNFHMKMQLQDGRKKPNTCMINQNTKTPKPSTLQPKMKTFTKKITKYSKFSSMFLQAYANKRFFANVGLL